VFYLQNAIKKIQRTDPAKISSDVTSMSAEIAGLKEEINVVLQEVIGVEHILGDGQLNYNDESIKSQAQTALANSATALTDVEEIRNKIEGIQKVNGNVEITSSNKITIYSTLNYNNQLEINENGVVLSGMKFEKVENGIKFTDTADPSHHVTLLWDPHNPTV
jgi:multidrug resistance efflux pump